MSPRTARYVEAMVREDFDYGKWLQSVREEEAQAKRAPTAVNPRDVVAARVDKPINTSGSWDLGSSLGLPVISKDALNLRAFRRPHRQAKSQTRKARLTRWLEKIRRASGEFQRSRRRDGMYIFLERVFEIVMHSKVRRRTNRLLRHAFKFARLPFDPRVDPFATIIRCTTGGDVDSKTISKYARALRYVARCKKSRVPLKRFMKKMGGLNSCAAAYAKTQGRSKGRHTEKLLQSRSEDSCP
jgi:hypothetical protein